jgi:hypothetical protein
MAQEGNERPFGPIVAGPGFPAIADVGASLIVRERTYSGPSCMHIHRSDDEAWHVLEDSLRFRFPDREWTPPQEPRSLCRPACRTLIGSFSPAAILFS